MRAALCSPAALLLLSLAACTAADPDMGLRSSAALMPQTTAATAPVGVFLPPEAGLALSSTEQAGPRSRLRRTVLRGDGSLPGENFVSVETSGREGTRPGLLRPPSVELLGGEMRAVLPGVPMQIAGTMDENASGPFGYALGSRGGTTCIYAWQWLDFANPGGLLHKRDPAGIRIRLCRRSGPSDLLRIVRAMRFAGSADDALLGMVPSGNGLGDALAATGVPASGSSAYGMADEPAVLAPAPAADAPPAEPEKVRRRAPAAPATSDSPPAAMADVPEIPLPETERKISASLTAPRKHALPFPPEPEAVPEPEADDEAPLIPDPGTTAATR